MTEEEAIYEKRLVILSDLIYRAIPIRKVGVASWNNAPAREFTDKVLLWMIGRSKAEELIKDYLKSHGADYYINEAVQFIFSAER